MLPPARLLRRVCPTKPCTVRYSSTLQPRKALKILFCGSDAFSIHSLCALHELSISSPNSIDLSVLCRPDKRTGRGQKVLRSVPIKSTAESLGLPLHQIDTFTGWTPPSAYDLVVAVSFGLRVPKRILEGAAHGGLNVHPSLLPDLKGPAPIQWALLHGDKYIGVTLQTLHATKIDGGEIVEQTPSPGLQVSPRAGMSEMIDLLGKEGAKSLVRHVGKLSQGHEWSSSPQRSMQGHDRHAPKIKPEDRMLDPAWDADTILRRDRIIGSLWQTLSPLQLPKGRQSTDSRQTRVTYHGWQEVGNSPRMTTILNGVEGACIVSMDHGPRYCFRTCDGRMLEPIEVTPEGRRRMSNASFTQSLLG